MLGRDVFAARRGDAEDAAALDILLVVAADAGVVPVRDEQRAIGGDAHVARPEPVVASAVKDVHHLSFIARAVFGRDIGPADVRPGVTVDYLVPKDFWQEATFISADARRRACARE